MVNVIKAEDRVAAALVQLEYIASLAELIQNASCEIDARNARVSNLCNQIDAAADAIRDKCMSLNDSLSIVDANLAGVVSVLGGQHDK